MYLSLGPSHREAANTGRQCGVQSQTEQKYRRRCEQPTDQYFMITAIHDHGNNIKIEPICSAAGRLTRRINVEMC